MDLGGSKGPDTHPMSRRHFLCDLSFLAGCISTWSFVEEGTSLPAARPVPFIALSLPHFPSKLEFTPQIGSRVYARCAAGSFDGYYGIYS